MGGWSRRALAWSAALGLAGLLGCADRALVSEPPPRPPDAGILSSDDAAVVPSRSDAGAATAGPSPDAGLPIALPVPVPVISGTVDAVDLIADPDGLYWLSSTDELWMLPPGAPSPRRLSTGGGAPPGADVGESFPGGHLATTGTDVFWIGGQPPAVRRTSKDGASDAILANGICSPATIAVDDVYVYWSDDANPSGDNCQGNGIIRTLPQTAAPGTGPISLASVQEPQNIATLAVQAGALYWAAFDAPGSTVYQGAWIWTAPVSVLLAGGRATSFGLTDTTYALLPIGETMYVASFEDRETTTLAELGSNGYSFAPLSILPTEAFVTFVAIVDQSWLAVTAVFGSNDRRLYVAPATGAGLVLAAVGLATNAVAGPTGATFVDTFGRLVALPSTAFATLTYGD